LEKNGNKYDLEERTQQFAVNVRLFAHKVVKTIAIADDLKQVVRSSGSIGANYIEANEALSKKDFIYRLKISRKEAKETVYWLNILLQTADKAEQNQISILLKEAEELKKIISSIINKSS
jgi:four helix bundle protein